MNSRKSKSTLNVAAQGAIMGCSVADQSTEADWKREEAERRAAQLQQIGAVLAVLAPSIQLTFDQLQNKIFEAMSVNGFWAHDQDNFASKVALVHSELSELLEANRKVIENDDKIPEFTGEEAEAADTIIRLLDMAGRYNWRLGEALVAKMLFNLSRPYKHGKAY